MARMKHLAQLFRGLRTFEDLRELGHQLLLRIWNQEPLYDRPNSGKDPNYLSVVFKAQIWAGLNHRDSEIRETTICRISALHKKGVPAYSYLSDLVDRLGDPDPVTVFAAVDLMGELAKKYGSTLAQLIYAKARANSKDALFFENAVHAIGYMFESGAKLETQYSNWLLGLMQEGSGVNDEIRKAAGEALSKFITAGRTVH